MKNTITRILIMGSLVALTACGGGGGGETTTPPAATISVIAADSTSVDLNSTDLNGSISTDCYANNSNGIIETVSISGTTLTYTVKTHTGDTSCSNAATTTTAEATLTIGSNQNVTSWVDGNSDPASVPAYAMAASGNLPANAPYTVLSATVTSSNNPDLTVNTTFSTGFVIDNSSSNGVVLYRVKDTATGVATTADPYTDIIPVTPPVASGPEIQITINSVYNTDLDSTVIAYTIENIGDTDTGPFYDIGWYDRASAPDYTDPLGTPSISIFSHSSLAAGATRNLMITVNGVNVTPGDTLNAYVIADFGEAVTESDEGLTGTNDNLSTKAWTVSSVFIHNGTTHVDNGTDPKITAQYITAQSRTEFTLSQQYIQNSGLYNNNHRLFIKSTLPATDTTYTGYSEIYAMYYINGIWYSPTLDDTTSTIRIFNAGQVGENIRGSYNLNLCPNNDIVGSACGVSKINHTGIFYIVRGADL